jgi:hypothetical protein
MSVPNVDDAVNSFVAIEQVKKANADKSKAIQSQADLAKSVIMKHMKSTNQTYLTVGDNMYLVLKEKSSKPAFNAEFLCALYKNFIITHGGGRGCTDEEAKTFVTYCETQQARLSTPMDDLVPTNKKPLSMMF